MGFPNSSMAFNAEQLEKLLRHAKVTQQSIQTVSTWILERRAFLNEIVDVWVRLLKTSEPHHQIVFLYIANDTMQVGVRKYGKHISEMFECKLLEVVTHLMHADGDEKVKRCVIKIIGIWKERNTVNLQLLEMLQNVCAGKPPVPEAPVTQVVSDDDRVKATYEAFVTGSQSAEGVELALSEMAEIPESHETFVMTQRLQDLVSASISADLLSDRMFQLQNSLTTFHHAVEAYNSADGPSAVAESKEQDEEEKEEKSAGDLVWGLLDQQVFDVDVDKSKEHVEQYRAKVETQNEKREQLVEHLDKLALLDPFQAPLFHTSPLVRAQQAQSLEQMYLMCLQAEIVASQRTLERQALYKSRPPVTPTTSSASPRRSSGGGTDYYRSSTDREQPVEHQHQRSSPGGGGGHRRYSATDSNSSREETRYSSYGSSRYEAESENIDGYYSKRPKLQHSQSLDDSSRRDRDRSRDRNRERPSSHRWDQSPRGGGDHHRSFQENAGYNDNRYHDDRSPRHTHQQQYTPTNSHNNHNNSYSGSRWDAYPPQEDHDRRDHHERRWER